MSEWISVEERLPEYGKWCLVVGRFGIVQRVAYVRDIGEWMPACEHADSVPNSYVTHWMPLPAPPPGTPPTPLTLGPLLAKENDETVRWFTSALDGPQEDSLPGMPEPETKDGLTPAATPKPETDNA